MSMFIIWKLVWFAGPVGEHAGKRQLSSNLDVDSDVPGFTLENHLRAGDRARALDPL